MLKQTFTDKLAFQVIEDLRNGVSLRTTVGHTSRGQMAGYFYTNSHGATVRIQAFQKEGGKNCKFIISITPKEGRTMEIPGKYASQAWKIISNPPLVRRSTGIVDKKAVNDALIALGMEA
jgi:hypothetical protein